MTDLQKLVARGTSVLSALVFGTSLLLPVAPDGEMFDGWGLLLVGWFGILAGHVGWLANLLLPVAWLLQLRFPRAALGGAAAALLVALTSVALFWVRVPEGGRLIIGGPGWVAWLLSSTIAAGGAATVLRLKPPEA